MSDETEFALKRRLELRAMTPARVSLGRTGVSLPTGRALEFALAHARARDAVHAALDVAEMLDGLKERGLQALVVRSAVPDRAAYLSRPDLGRVLATVSRDLLIADSTLMKAAGGTARLAVILADGLSALAVQRHALALVDALLPLLAGTWALTPIAVAEQARVALGDHVGELLHADATLVLIGERPGLSSPDSLGAYITWAPRPGRSDAERNCVSNIRMEGLDYATAGQKIAWYLNESRRLGLSGVAIRENDLLESERGIEGGGQAGLHK